MTLIIKNVCIQISTPSFSSNEFGYYASFKTHFQIGKSGFGIIVLGFGFSIAFKNLIEEQNSWFWDAWKKECILKKLKERTGG